MAKKTNPIGIRFDIDDLKTALEKSGKQTCQQLVSFLISNYIGYKHEKPVTNQEVKRSADDYIQMIRDANSPKERREIRLRAGQDKLLSSQEKSRIRDFKLFN